MQVHLQFPSLEKICDAKLIAFSDTSFASLKCGGSQGGFLIFLCGENKKYALISWQSKKVKRVVKSTIAAETLALQEAAEASILIRHVICELFGYRVESTTLPIECVIDNKSLYDSLHSTKTVSDKRLKVDICHLRDMVKNEEIHEIQWKENKKQLADVLTKFGASSEKLLKVLHCESAFF